MVRQVQTGLRIPAPQLRQAAKRLRYRARTAAWVCMQALRSMLCRKVVVSRGRDRRDLVKHLHAPEPQHGQLASWGGKPAWNRSDKLAAKGFLKET